MYFVNIHLHSLLWLNITLTIENVKTFILLIIITIKSFLNKKKKKQKKFVIKVYKNSFLALFKASCFKQNLS